MPAIEIKTGIVVLAAGASSRLGEPKQLLRFREKTLIRRAVETAASVGDDVKTIVVTGAHAEKIEKEIADLNCLIARNENWKSGMSASIKTGVEALLEVAPDTDAVIISLCDQPLIGTDHFEKLIGEFSRTGKAIVCSRHSDSAGVPALFSRKYFPHLLNIQGERGAKNLINQNLSDAAQVEFSQNPIDIDTAEDYKKLLALDLK